MVDLLIENYRCQTGKVDYREAGSHRSAPGGDWDQSQEQSIKVFSLHVPVPEEW